MEKGAKIFLGLLGLAVAIGGSVAIYNKVNAPSLEMYDNIQKTATYRYKGKKQFVRLNLNDSLSLGSNTEYIISPLIENGKIVGVVLKNGNKIIDKLVG